MILVCVQSSDDLEPARAFIAALAPARRAFLLFLRPGLRDRYGVPACSSAEDARICLLNPHNFVAVVSFSGRREASSMPNLLVLDYFAELGVPTIEVQSAGEPAPAGGVENPAGFELGYAAHHRLSWTGAAGIGFLCSARETEPAAPFAPGFVLISADFQRLAPSGRERYALALALLALLAAEPAEHFVWCVHPEEDEDARRMRELVTAYELPNLAVVRDTPPERLVRDAGLAIASRSALLAHLAFHRKPVLEFVPLSETAGGEPGGAGFAHGGELTRAFRALRASPADFVPVAPWSGLRSDVLHAELDRICAQRTLAPHSLGRALPYLDALERAARPPAREDLESITAQLARVTEKLTTLHRSTLAYKAKRLAKRLGLPLP